MSITQPDDRVTSYNPVVPTTTFAADFPVFDNDDIVVFVNGIERDDFTVSATYAQSISNDARVIFNTGITGSVLVVGARKPRRSNRFGAGPINANMLNAAFDTVQGEMQEARRDVDRSLKVPVGSSPLGIPAPVDNWMLGWLGNQLANIDPSMFVNMAGTATASQGANADAVSLPSRAYAIASFHPITAPDFVRTAGYSNQGDFGGALYKKVASQPAHQGKFVITLAGIGAMVWYELTEPMVTPEMFGAKGDDPGDGTGTDDLAAFQNALNMNRRLFIPRNKKYRLNGTLQIPRFPQILGMGSRTASEHLTDFNLGAPVLVFTGTGTACMINQDPATMMSHGKIGGFSLRCNGTYAWMMDFRTCVDMVFEEIRMQTDAANVNGFRSRKILPSDDSWLNTMQAVSVRLPDASTARTLDVDWSDSPIEKCQFTGGVGSVERGFGCRFVSCQFERSNYIGLTILKSYATKMTIVSACQFDANKTHGVAIDVTGDTSGQPWLDFTIVNNGFRTVDPNTGAAGAADIALINPTGNTYYGGAIGPNSHMISTVLMKVEAGQWALTKFVGSHVRDMTTIPWAADDANFWADARGINVPKGMVAARGARNVFGHSNVAGFFGNSTLGEPGIVVGAIPGVGPFIGASLDGSLAAKPLLLYTGNVERLRVTADGSSLRPAVDNVTDLGQASNRMRTIYAGTSAISTSDENLKADISPISDAVLDAWQDVEWCQFRFKDGKRLHTGLIAQMVYKAFEAKGINAFEYGLLCFDEWGDEFEEREVEILNEDGSAKILTEKVKVSEAGSRWGVRYEEALALEAALMRRTINRLSKSS